MFRSLSTGAPLTSRDQLPSLDEVLGPRSPLARKLASYESRPGQLEMARGVLDALVSGTDHAPSHLIVEAGTGTGKTFAYLTAAVLSQRKVVISTATRALEEQIFDKDLPIVRQIMGEHGISVQAALMKGLSNYLCKRRLSEAQGHSSREMQIIDRWALETETGDRAELAELDESSLAWADVQSGTDTRIGAGCKFFDECFVTRMRRAAESAQIVVVNHHLFFADLALRSANGLFGAIPPYDAVIFDEAHHLENIATEFFGVRVSSARVSRLVRDARAALVSASVLNSRSMALVDQVTSSAEALFGMWQASLGHAGASAESRRILRTEDWTPARRAQFGRLDAALEALGALAYAHVEDDAMSVLARRTTELRSDLLRIRASHGSLPVAPAARSYEDMDEAVVPAPAEKPTAVGWVDAKERSISLGSSPIEVGPLLREKLFSRCKSVVLTSATLATGEHGGLSFRYAKERLMAGAPVAELLVSSPFDFTERAGLYVATDLPEPQSPGFDVACAARAAELIEVTQGGAFVLCTSNRAMRSMHAALSSRLGSIGPVLMQGAGPKHMLLERFRAAGSAVLVATMSFWEGVDVPGRALRLVVIDKIPFAVPTDPIVMARSAVCDAEGGNSFMQVSVPAAAITLKQGFGRLIRSKTDAGIVALLDRRAEKRGYGRALLASLPPARRLRSVDSVRDFWRSID